MEDDKFSFNNYNTTPAVVSAELIKNTTYKNEAVDKEKAKKDQFLKIDDSILNEDKSYIETPEREQPRNVSVPYETQGTQNTYLSLVLSPNLREIELLIRGLEYVKKYNRRSGREEVTLQKIDGHPLNEYGINQILTYLKIFGSPEIKLGRKRVRDYYNSVAQASTTIKRMIYKNLDKFGMDTEEKKRFAKPMTLAIIEFLDASYSRSIEGKENDLSRATEFKIEGNIDTLNDPAKMFNQQRKDELKN